MNPCGLVASYSASTITSLMQPQRCRLDFLDSPLSFVTGEERRVQIMYSYDCEGEKQETGGIRQAAPYDKLSELWVKEHKDSNIQRRGRSSGKFLQLVYSGLLGLTLCYLAWISFARSLAPRQTMSQFENDLTAQIERKFSQALKYAKSDAKASGQDPFLKFQRYDHFDFNVTSGENVIQSWELIQSSLDEPEKKFAGKIIVDRGSELQSSDITIVVFISSSNKASLDDTVFQKSRSGLHIEHNNARTKDDFTNVEILVYLRPWPKRSVDLFTIRTDALDLWIMYSMNWNFNNLVVHTTRGQLTMQNNHLEDTYLAKNVSGSSTHGLILGSFVADENLELRNEHGSIVAFLEGRHSVPFEPKSISIFTQSGDILATKVQGAWPVKPYTHRTDIKTVAGEIATQVAHGSSTTIASFNGKIVAYLITYAVSDMDAPSDIYTATYSGEISVSVSDPEPDPYNEISPLANTTSEHVVGIGSLDVRYGNTWYGEMYGGARIGGWEVHMPPAEIHSGHDGNFHFRRGKGGKSEMMVSMGTGDVFVEVG